MPDLSYCGEQIRRHDNDRFVCALFAPPPEREALAALYAFNLEVARIPEVVRETLLGHMRLQWWRDCIAAIYEGAPPEHQVAMPLAEAVARHGLERSLFDRLLDARAADLDPDPPTDLGALIRYADDTSGALTGLALTVLGAGDAADAGRDVGIAWALTGLLRAVPFHAQTRRCYLPADLCRDAGLDVENVFALKSGPELAQVVAVLAETASDHLRAARSHQKEVPKAALPALLPATIAERDLARLRRAGHDPFALDHKRDGFGRLLRVTINGHLGRY